MDVEVAVRKKFEKTLYDQYNGPAIEKVIRYVTEVSGRHAVPNSGDRYVPDIQVYKGLDVVSYIEVEMVLKWEKGEFPWPVVNIPERKEKYLDLGIPLEFWRLSADMQQAVIVPDYAIDRDKHRQIVPNSKVRYGEKFFRVPLELCMVIDLEQ